ncbi:MAG: DmsE family decaheme c-type cytochrome [Acidobacteriota bacterium]
MTHKFTISLAVALVLGLFAAGRLPAQDYAGSQSCQGCHPDQAKLFEANVHFKAAEQRRFDAQGEGCESCHGPSKPHADDPVSKKPAVAFAKGEEGRSNGACIACHRTDDKVNGYSRSRHAQSRVACVDCHASPHSKVSLLPARTAFRNEDAPLRVVRHLKTPSADLCLSCHTDLRGRFRMPYRHPLGGQALACVSCHNPHQDETRQARQANAKCFSCHEDKRGPWAYEHPPATEDCASCHEPHGSVAPGMLKTAQPFQCLSCHSIAEDRHGAEVGGARFSRALFSRCTACHGAIHGSHEDRHFKK